MYRLCHVHGFGAVMTFYNQLKAGVVIKPNTGAVPAFTG